MPFKKHRHFVPARLRWTFALVALCVVAMPVSATLLYPFFQDDSENPVEDAVIYKIKDSDGNIVLAVDKNGNLALAGTLTENLSTVSSGAGHYRKFTGSDTVVKAILEIEDGGTSIGNLLLKGQVIHHEDMDSLAYITSPSPLDPSFMLQNAGHYKVALDKDGNLHIRGRVFEHMTSFDFSPPEAEIQITHPVYAGREAILASLITPTWIAASADLRWSVATGPGVATFTDAHAATTGVTFGATGGYTIKLTVNNHFGGGPMEQTLAVTVESAPAFMLCP